MVKIHGRLVNYARKATSVSKGKSGCGSASTGSVASFVGVEQLSQVYTIREDDDCITVAAPSRHSTAATTSCLCASSAPLPCRYEYLIEMNVHRLSHVHVVQRVLCGARSGRALVSSVTAMTKANLVRANSSSRLGSSAEFQTLISKSVPRRASCM